MQLETPCCRNFVFNKVDDDGDGDDDDGGDDGDDDDYDDDITTPHSIKQAYS